MQPRRTSAWPWGLCDGSCVHITLLLGVYRTHCLGLGEELTFTVSLFNLPLLNLAVSRHPKESIPLQAAFSHHVQQAM